MTSKGVVINVVNMPPNVAEISFSLNVKSGMELIQFVLHEFKEANKGIAT